MNKPMKWSCLLLVVVLVTGCTYYQTTPGVYTTTPPSTFNRSFSAVVLAFEDQGVRITSEDRSTGEVVGSRDGIDVRATLQTQADGSVRVAFNTSGSTGNDPELIDRVTRSYNRFMGR
jgi:hypothetical protein